MEINSSGRNIQIELSPSDLEGLDITFADIDYANAQTRRVIRTLLEMAGVSLGKDIDPSGQMVMEASETVGGGCLLNFTVPDGEKRAGSQKPLIKRKNKNGGAEVWEFRNLESAAGACLAISSAYETVSSFYALGGKYRLVLEKPFCADNILKEFGFKVFGKSALPGTLENWKCLAEREAVKKLARLG